MSTFQDLKYKFSTLNVFGKIIAINSIIFIAGFLMSKLFRYSRALYYLELPSDLSQFILKPWTLITYGFAHYGLLHFLFNMLFLYIISRVLLNLFRVKMTLNIYFLGIIFGGLSYLLAYNVLPSDVLQRSDLVVGASAGIRALIIFVAFYLANTEIRIFTFNVKWKYIGILLIVLDLIGLMGSNQGGHIAHLGGALLGYIYAVQLQKGKDIGSGFERLMDSFMSLFKSKGSLKTVHRKRGKASFAGHKREEFKEFNKQKQIDVILDKISKSGYESLTEEEKQFLFKAGKDQ